MGGCWGQGALEAGVASHPRVPPPLPSSAPQAPPPDAVAVGVRLLWDVLEPEPDSAPPLYVLWRLHSELPGGFGEEGKEGRGSFVRGGGGAAPTLRCSPPPPPGNVPGRLQAWPRRAPSVSLAFLEAVLSHVGLSEVHKAIALFLDAGGPQHMQR